MNKKLLTFFFFLLIGSTGVIFGQSINIGVPIHTVNKFDRSLPMQDWECSGPQLALGTHELNFLDIDGSIGDYVDCHGRLHGLSGGGTVTQVTINGGTNITLSGDCNSDTIVNCTINSSGSGIQSAALVMDGTVYETAVPGSPILPPSGTFRPTLRSEPAGYALLGPRPVVPGIAAFVQQTPAIILTGTPSVFALPPLSMVSATNAGDALILSIACIGYDVNTPSGQVVTDTQGNTWNYAAASGPELQMFTTGIVGGNDAISGTFTYGVGAVCPIMVASAIEVTNLNGIVDAYSAEQLTLSPGTYVNGPMTTATNYDFIFQQVSVNNTILPTIAAIPPVFTIEQTASFASQVAAVVYADSFSTFPGVYSSQITSPGQDSGSLMVAYRTGGTFNYSLPPTFRPITSADLPGGTTLSPFTVYNNIGNTYAGGNQDFRNASSLEVPQGTVTAGNAQIVYDAFHNFYHFYVAGGDAIVVTRPDTPDPVDGDCAAWENSGGVIQAVDSGVHGCTGSSSPNTVLNNQANTYSTGLQDLSAATGLYVPSGAGAVGTHAGDINFDITALNYHGFAGGEDIIFIPIPAGLNPGNGNCPDFVVVAGFISLGDTGSPCGSGGGGSGTVTSFDAVNITGFASKSVATPTVTPVLTYTLDNASANQFWGGPTSGGATTPAYRALVSADIPNNAASTSNTAANLSGTPALPNGTTATTQTTGDTTTKLATDAFVLNNIGTRVPDTTVTVTSALQGANSCSLTTNVTMPGLSTAMVVDAGYSSNPGSLTGWGSTGGMVFQIWPSATSTATWQVCNQTTLPITFSTITFNVGGE